MFKRSSGKIDLPHKFAQDLLDSEIELKLTDKPSQQLIKKTIELYTIGVEYYESIRSYKYLYFQQKMTELFMSQAMNRVLCQQKLQVQTQTPIKLDSQEDRIEAIKIKQKQQKLKHQFIQRTKEQTTENQAKVILDKSESSHAKVQQKMKAELDIQDRQLQQKMKKRKSRMLTARCHSLCQNLGDLDSKSSTCTKQQREQKQLDFVVDKKKASIVKPIEVSFNSVIHQSQDQDQANHADQVQKKRRKLSISDKIRKNKLKSTSDLMENIQQ